MTWQRIPMKERIERNSVSEPMTGCWLWTGKVDAYGYGTMHNRTMNGPNDLKAHRVSYEQYIGQIPEKMHVCHVCDVPSCVNPNHLWLGTASDNHKDRAIKGRSANGNRLPQAKLNPEKVLAIRKATGTMKEIGAQFGVAPQTAHKVRKLEIWKHV
jgi:hypothetical protein